MSPQYTLATPSDDEKESYNETVGGAVVADALKERNGYLRGSFAINGVMIPNFEANSAENVVAQINAQQARTGVYAQMDEDGHLKLSHASSEPILIERGPNYAYPNRPGEPARTEPTNTVLDDLGLEETTELNAARAQQLSSNGRVGQVGDGGVIAYSGAPPSRGQFQSAEEIEAQNRAIMSNPRGISSGSPAPHAPHETVVGTTTTGNRPIPQPADSNAQRVVLQPQTPEEQEAADKARDEGRNRPMVTGMGAGSPAGGPTATNDAISTGAPSAGAPAGETEEQRRQREENDRRRAAEGQAGQTGTRPENPTDQGENAEQKAERERREEEARKQRDEDERRRREQGGQPA